MAALTVSPERLDWIALRQILALSLANMRPVTVAGAGAWIGSEPKYQPIFNDLCAACLVTNAGTLEISGNDISCSPSRPSTGTISLETGPFSSAVEVLLFLLPALFNNDFRTVLNFHGVTHSPHSYPTAFIKETLLPVLEQYGLYASLTLGRFGFYGSGGGILEARAYPAEPKACAGRQLFTGERKIEGARVFVAGASVDLARKEVETMHDGLGLPEGKISILEIRDADGFGNTLLAYVRCGEGMMVIHRDMEMYDWRGDFIFDGDLLSSSISAFMAEVRNFACGGNLPAALLRELVPFVGSEVRAYDAAGGAESGPVGESLRLYSAITGK